MNYNFVENFLPILLTYFALSFPIGPMYIIKAISNVIRPYFFLNSAASPPAAGSGRHRGWDKSKNEAIILATLVHTLYVTSLIFLFFGHPSMLLILSLLQYFLQQYPNYHPRRQIRLPLCSQPPSTTTCLPQLRPNNCVCFNGSCCEARVQSSEDCRDGNPDEGASDSVASIFDNLTCLHGDGNVFLKSGAVKLVQAVFHGGKVAIGQFQFSPVFMFTQRDAHFETVFLLLRVCTTDTSNNCIADLRVTTHFVHINRDLVAANQIMTKDEVRFADGTWSQVICISSFVHSCNFNPQTLHGYICGTVCALLDFCLQSRRRQFSHLWNRYVQRTLYVELSSRCCFE